MPPDRDRKGRLASSAMAPLTRKVSSTRTPWVLPRKVRKRAAGSDSSSGARRRRSLSICWFARMLPLVVTLPVAATEPASNCAKSAVVALSVFAALTVTSWSSVIPAAAKEARAVLSMALSTIGVPRSSGVSTKLEAVRLLQKMSAGSGLVFRAATRPSRAVTCVPSPLKVEVSTYLESDSLLDQQSTSSSSAEPLPRMGRRLTAPGAPGSGLDAVSPAWRKRESASVFVWRCR